MNARLVNYVLYQAGWFACVLGARSGRVALGTGLGVAAVAAHVALARRRRDELVLALGAAAIGIAIDTVQIALGTLAFEAGTVVPGLPPVWLAVLWMQFAATFHYSFRWLAGRPAAAVLFGAVGGPLAFVAGARLGIVRLHPALWPSLATLALSWSVAIPAMVRLAERQRGRPGAGEYRV